MNKARARHAAATGDSSRAHYAPAIYAQFHKYYAVLLLETFASAASSAECSLRSACVVSYANARDGQGHTSTTDTGTHFNWQPTSMHRGR
jgi:hypothetical protein